MPGIAKMEFNRLTEEQRTNNRLTFTSLKSNIVVAARKVPRNNNIIATIQQESRTRVPEAPGRSTGSSEGERKEPPRSSRRETRTCFYCHKPGHIARNCYKRMADLQAKNKENKSESEEKDGIRANNSTASN